MGIMDKLKGLLKGREREVKQGIDTVSNKVEGAVGPKHAQKVDDISDKAKDAVDKLADSEPPSPSAAPAPPATPPTPAPPATPATPPAADTPPAAPPAG
jgi:hypothetical protein